MDEDVPLSALGEREAIERIFRILEGSAPDNSLGDDTAYIEWGDAYLLLTNDMITRPGHVPAGASPEQVGWYLAAVNLSDIAAMGGEPLGLSVALGLPRDTPISYLEGIMEGAQSCCATFGTSVVGGDTKEAPDIVLTGTAVGRVPRSEILLRSGAREGDLLAVTGELGGAAAALRLLEEGENAEALDVLMRPLPRIQAGRELAGSGAATSCIDISDGLALSAHYLARASGTGVEVDWDSIPCHSLMDAAGLDENERMNAALYAGGDFELLATLDPVRYDALAGTGQLPELTIIGTVRRGGENTLRKGANVVPLEERGYEHFRG